jgi:hypothetical protein
MYFQQSESPPNRTANTEIVAIWLGAGYLGSFFAAGLYVVTLLVVNQHLIPTFPKTNISYGGQDLLIDLPVAAFLGFVLGSTCLINFYVPRIFVLIPPLLLTMIVLYLQIENWRQFGFGKDKTVEAFCHFPGVIVSSTTLLILIIVLLLSALSSTRTPE